MTITFYCEFCQSEFTVDSKLAGRKARCKRCDREMRIPHSNAPRRTSTANAAAKVAAGRSLNWLDAVSQINLKAGPVVAKSPAVKRILDAPEDSVTSYKIHVPQEMRLGNVVKKRISTRAAKMAEAGAITNRKFFNSFSRLFRKINDAAYGISLIFLIMTIVGVILEKHAIVVFGVSMIVLLNIAGLAAGVANLITINFRRNPVRGLLFLVPPITVYYLLKDADKWSKPLGRIITPAVILIAVVAAYKYIPWLNGSDSKNLNWREAVNTIKQDVKGSVSDAKQELNRFKGQLPDQVQGTNLEDLQQQATDAVNDVTGKIRKAVGNEAAPASDPPANSPEKTGSP